MTAFAFKLGLMAFAIFTRFSMCASVFKSRRLGLKGNNIWVATVIAERKASES